MRAENSDLNAALDRLDESEMVERDRRLKMAFDASMKRVYLPEFQWTNYSRPHRYLENLLAEVKEERKEREIFRA